MAKKYKWIRIEVVEPENEKTKKKRTLKEFLTDAKNAVFGTASNIIAWVDDNKEDIAKVTAIAGFVTMQVKRIQRKRALALPYYQRERARIEHTYYDPVTHTAWALKRPLTNTEKAYILERKRKGDYVEEILDDLGVLM